MGDRKWTGAQQDAISARGGTVLVSAAAGSGKTAVLVERVISRLTDPVSPVDADRMLVVTFTRAAAAEMKDRIAARLSQMQDSDPQNPLFRRQQLLLSRASISTVHSFCKDLIQENFYRLGISPEFRILDDGEMRLLREEAVSETLEAFYATGGEAFAALVDAFGSEKDDRKLGETALQLYDFIRSHPFPDRWLREKAEMYRAQTSIAQSAWGEELFHTAQETLSYCKMTLTACLHLCASDPAVEAAYGPAFSSDLQDVAAMDAAAQNRDWDGLRALFAERNYQKLKPLRGTAGEAVKGQLKSMRKETREVVDKLQKRFCASQAECGEDLQRMAPLAETLFSVVRAISDQLETKKQEKRAVDFGDLEHLSLRLLVRETDAGYERTAEAEAVSERFDEIMVDEYQDTNETQDLLFRAVSREEQNLFMVGDVKQSIYGFRQAMPRLFLDRKNTFSPYRREAPQFPAYILLDRNFRSRREVTSAVNFVFNQLMSRRAGDVDYRAGEQLVAGAEYPANGDFRTRLEVIDASETEESMDVLEARRIAAMIREFRESGAQVLENGKPRPVEPRDFCVLLRSAKEHAPVYVRELEKCGVMSWAESPAGFFSYAETALMLSLLRVIDNPMQDIPLLAVMMSPIYGFSADEMAQVRMEAGGPPLYPALLRCAQNGNLRIQAFLAELEEFRMLAATMPADTLINTLYRKTGYPELVGAMPGGELRGKNLQLLHQYAKNYEQFGYNGLHGFLRFVDRLAEQGGDLAAASVSQEGANVVRVMSIHKSKGLEFPYCIVAGCARRFNRESSDTVLHAELGFGAKLPGKDGVSRYTTAPREAILSGLLSESVSEELRVLYVAMTRAREKLILLTTLSRPDRTFSSLAAGISPEPVLPSYAVRRAGSISDWLLSCALRHPDGKLLREMAGAEETLVLPKDPETLAWEIRVSKPEGAPCETQQSAQTVSKSDPAFLGTLAERVAYRYPYAAVSEIPAKVSASGVSEEAAGIHTLSRPAFVSSRGMTPAERGTALHAFMQFCDYRAASENLEAERVRLREAGYLTPEQADVVELERIRKFLQSDLAARMMRSKRLLRENRFTVEIEAGRIDPSLPEATGQEKLVLQGVFDCAFEEDGGLIIVDYKTDRIASPELLAERYHPQLSLYREAAEQTFGLPVYACVLYSFWLGKEIQI